MNTRFSPAVLRGKISAPASKSEAHRRLICAGLTAGETTLSGFMPSEDMTATLHCLRALGAEASADSANLTVRGGAYQPELLPVYDCGESGSTLRFFVPIALAKTRGGVFRMHGRLGQRPMDVYRDLFVPGGVTWHMGEGADDAAELTVIGQMQPGGYTVPGSVSSQFVSGLLFALPMLEGSSLLTVTPPVESASYIAMTVQALRESGITLTEEAPFTWRIPGFQQYHAVSGALEGDWSQAAVLLCADALGAKVHISGLNEQSLQGDRAILAHLERLGATIHRENDALYVTADQLHGAELDMQNTPDIAPILALVCQLAEGDSVLTHCGRLRLKESDRLATTVAMLNALGGQAHVEGDSLIIHGVERLTGGTVDTCHDHRMVMLAAIAALRASGPVETSGAEALAKSWPGFLSVYRSLGGRVS